MFPYGSMRKIRTFAACERALTAVKFEVCILKLLLKVLLNLKHVKPNRFTSGGKQNFMFLSAFCN